MADPFKLEVVSPEKLVYQADVKSVAVPGESGYFTVMKNHTSVLTTLKVGLLNIETGDGERLRYFVKGGFADVQPETLIVLAEDAKPLDEVDPETLNSAIQDAEADIGAAQDEVAKKLAESKLRELKEILVVVKTA